MRAAVAAVALGLIAVPVSAGSEDDPHIWLEEVRSPKVDAWIAERNGRTEQRLTTDRRYAALRGEALAILGAKDRIPLPNLTTAKVTNFWQDETHLRGIWRTTSLAEYGKAQPVWQTVLDIDALGKAEGKSWVFRDLPRWSSVFSCRFR